MDVHYNIETLPVFPRAVITIGTFDGVHTGHQQIITQLKDEALQIRGQSILITFDPHPRRILGTSAGSLKLINTTQEKIELLSSRQIDHLVVVPFTDSFSRLTAEEYIRDFLVATFRPHTIIIGYDHRFGQGRKGDYHLMEAYSSNYGYRLVEIPAHVLHEASVSSTRIREAVASGDILTANELLGYSFFFEGLVTEGSKLGRTIGYPTANLQVQNAEKLLPGQGVYAVEVARPGHAMAAWKGMMNIGTRPTVQGQHMTIEVHIFDFDQDIYGSTLRIYVRKFLRMEQKFDGLEALTRQLDLDRTAARAYLEQA